MIEGLGIGVVTYNREKQISKVLEPLVKESAEHFVIVNDGAAYAPSVYPSHFHVIQHSKNQSVCVSKNDCLRYLMKKNCRYMIIIEDDMIVNPAIFEKYISLSKVSGIQHLMYGYHGAGNIKDGKPNPRFSVEYDVDNKMSLNLHCVGAVIFYTKEVIEKVGYMDEKFNKNTWEHCAHTYDIIKAGYHPAWWNFCDLYNSNEYIKEIDGIENSVIRKSEEWTKNMMSGRAYFKYKYGVDILAIPDTPQSQVYSWLEKKQNDNK